MRKKTSFKRILNSRMNLGIAFVGSMATIGTTIAACGPIVNAESEIDAGAWLTGEFVNYDTNPDGTADVIVGGEPIGAHYLFSVNNAAPTPTIPQGLRDGQVVTVTLVPDEGFSVTGENVMIMVINTNRTTIRTTDFLQADNFVFTGTNGAGRITPLTEPPLGVEYRVTYNGQTVPIATVTDLSLGQEVVISLVVKDLKDFELDLPSDTVQITVDAFQSGTEVITIANAGFLVPTNFRIAGIEGQGTITALRSHEGASYEATYDGQTRALSAINDLKSGQVLEIRMVLLDSTSHALAEPDARVLITVPELLPAAQVILTSQYLTANNFAFAGTNGSGTVTALKHPTGASYLVTHNGNTTTLSALTNLKTGDQLTIRLQVDNPDLYVLDNPTNLVNLVVPVLDGAEIQTLEPATYLQTSNFTLTGSENHASLHAVNALPIGAEYRISVNGSSPVAMTSVTNLKNGDSILITIVINDLTKYQLGLSTNGLTYEVSGLTATPVGDSLVIGDSTIGEKLYAGQSATQAEVFQLMDAVSLGDILSGPGQVGIQMPGPAWSALQEPSPSAINKDQTFAPYIDGGLTSSPTTDFGTLTAADPGFINFAVLSFIQEANDTVVRGTFAGVIDEGTPQFESLVTNINALRARGGDVTLSFGGANGTPMWRRANDPVLLASYYYQLAKAGKFHTMDFDLEGADLTEMEGIIRNATALRIAQDKLASEGFEFNVTLTLPVLPGGLTADGVKALQAYYDSGVRLKAISIMNFDYGDQTQGYANAVLALENTASQLANISGLTQAEALKFMSTIQMPPVDDQSWPWTVEDSNKLLAYAIEHELYSLSLWSLNRDATMVGGENSAILRSYGTSSQRAPITFGKSGVEIYQNGNYKPELSASNAAYSLDPASIPPWSAEAAHPATVVIDIDGEPTVFTSAFFTNGQRPSKADITAARGQSPWKYLGTLDFYTKYYNQFVKQLEPTPGDAGSYFFLQHNGQAYVDPNANGGGNDIGLWWQENAWDWAPGRTANTGNVYKWGGQVWIALFFANNNPGTPGNGGANWKIFNPATDTPVAYGG